MAELDIVVPTAQLPPPPSMPFRGSFPAPSPRWVAPPPPADRSERSQRSLRSGWKLWLAKQTGLLPYGDIGLSPAAQKHLTTAAFLLAALWFIDLLAWFGLWNLLLTGSLRAMEPLTGVAAALGLLFATAILHYESSFLTADLRRSTHPRISIAIRIFLIVFTAFATSLPVEMYLLEDQIETRLHQEEVLAQIPALVQRWEQARQQIEGNAVTQAERDAATVRQREALDAAARDRLQAETNHRDAQRDVAAQRGQLFALENRVAQGGEPSDIERVTNLVASARTRLNRLVGREQTLAGALAAARSRESEADLALKEQVAKLRAVQVRDAASEARRYEMWLHDLWNAAPRQVVNERSSSATDPLTYDGVAVESRIGIGEQLIALTDVLSGHSPRRPRISRQDQETLRNMNLAAFIEDDEEGLLRQEAEAASLFRLVLLSVFGFTFVPMLIFALKFLFDDDTRAYLDRDYQCRLGNPAVPESPADTLNTPLVIAGPQP